MSTLGGGRGMRTVEGLVGGVQETGGWGDGDTARLSEDASCILTTTLRRSVLPGDLSNDSCCHKLAFASARECSSFST